MSSSGGQPTVTIGGTLPAGDNNIGNMDVVTLPSVTIGAALPAGTNNIGDVDVLTLPDVTIGSMPNVTISSLPNVTIGSMPTAVVTGDVAHDSADSGSPVKTGGKAATSLPTAVANADRVDSYYNEYGEQGVLGGGRTVRLTANLTGSTSAYATGDAVGGLITLTNAVRKSGGSGLIHTITLIDDAKQAASFDLVLFDQTFTATADNAAFDPSDADLENCLGYVSIVSGNYSSFNDNAVATVRSVGLPIVCSGSASLFGQLVARGTPTLAASTDLTVTVFVLQD